jgi:hypothetical protein
MVKPIKRKAVCRDCGMTHEAIQQEMVEAMLEYPDCVTFERGPDGKLRPSLGDWPEAFDTGTGNA